MAAYVDRLQRHGFRQWCHLIADTEAELHAIAQRCGLRRIWYQSLCHASFPHYDAQERIRSRLVAVGAIEVTARELGAHMARIRVELEAGRWSIPGSACPMCRGRGWFVGECHPQEECGTCAGTGVVPRSEHVPSRNV